MKALLRTFKSLFTMRDNPESIARGFGLGSFIGMMPIPGLQVIVALALATVFKVNKRAACIAVFNTNVVTGAFIFAFNYWLGKTLLGITSAFEMPQEMNLQFMNTLMKAGWQVFMALVVGGVVTGIPIAILSYFGMRYWVVFQRSKCMNPS